MPLEGRMDKEDVLHMYNGILLSHEINEIRPVVATRVDLDTTIISDISQTEKETYHKIITYRWNLKVDTYELTYKTETESQI